MEDNKIDETTAETIAQLAANHKLAQESAERAKIEKEAKEFIDDVSNNDAEKEKWQKMYDSMKE